MNGGQTDTGSAAARLHLHVIASGSKGNAAIVENGATGHGVLVDCGVTKKAFFAGCESSGFDPAKLDAILITHEHTDHTKGLGVVTRGLAKLGVTPTLYASDKVRTASSQVRAVQETLGEGVFQSGDDLSIAGIAIHAFPTSHDAAESFGFRFDFGKDSIGFMTDTGIVTGEAREALRECRVLGIEANHDLRMLKYGPYPASLKTRIAGDGGHLSNEQSADLLESLLSDRLEQVVALHISENNNDYALPVQALARTLARNDHPAHAQAGYQRTSIDVW